MAILQRLAGRRYGLPAAIALAMLAALAGCSRQSDSQVPVRADGELPVPSETSFLSLPVEIDSRILLQAVEEEVPRALWSIDRRFERCIPKKRVKILGERINVVPKVPCTVQGQVTRGDIRMRGDGRDIVLDIPINARLAARDVGGVIKQETATGSAMVQAHIRLELAPDWSPRGTVRLRHSWTRAPGIDILGQRVTFTDQADKELRPIMRRLEASLPQRLAGVGLRREVEKLWNAGFTTIRLSRANPQAWMRVTPKRPVYDGYELAGSRIHLKMGLEAVTETFVGEKPPAPLPMALPAPARSAGARGLNLHIPVVADYAEIEPVIQKALDKRSRRPFDLPTIGEVDARFSKVTAYGTAGGKLAVGLDVTARPASKLLGERKGRIWLVAKPVNRAGSAEVGFEQLSVTGDISGAGGDLLLSLANSEGVVKTIEQALAQNFTKDRDKLVEKIGKAIAVIRKGDFTIRSNLAEIETGEIEAYGKALYLPVRASGTAAIDFRPGG